MDESIVSMVIYPERGVGWITLGASLHGVLTRLKSQPIVYPKIDLCYSASDPLREPVILHLLANGLRLRFDGPDQRLRLIEIVDFSKTTFTYKNIDLVKKTSALTDHEESVEGPSFQHLYKRLFGPSYPGEYIPPTNGALRGTYVLSYPGLAARFHLKHRSWSASADFVALLSSSAASAAASIAVFQGASWPEACKNLYTATPKLPRSITLAGRNADLVADEVEEVAVHCGGRLELSRRVLPPFVLRLGMTTPQDLVAELGPPDSVYRKPAAGIAVHADSTAHGYARTPSTAHDTHHADHEYPSGRSYADESDNDSGALHETTKLPAVSEVFYNYFHHGFDILIQPSSEASASTRIVGGHDDAADFVVTKVFLHGNVPGSFSFNRHRRSRWRVLVNDDSDSEPPTSEHNFARVQSSLRSAFRDHYANREEEARMQRGMVLNRGWGESPESSIELLGGFEEGPRQLRLEDEPASNTQLFGFPGMLFEVMKNDAIVCLTVY